MIDYEDVTLVEVSKMGDWKNISQRETDARNARRTKKRGTVVASTGGALIAADLKGTKAGLSAVKESVKSYSTSRRPGVFNGIKSDGTVHQVKLPPNSRRAALGSAKMTMRNAAKGSKGKFAYPAVGASLLATGLTAHGAGLAKERYSDKKIAGMRKKRDK